MKLDYKYKTCGDNYTFLFSHQYTTDYHYRTPSHWRTFVISTEFDFDFLYSSHSSLGKSVSFGHWGWEMMHLVN